MGDNTISSITIEDFDTHDSLLIPVGKDTPHHHFIYMTSQQSYRPWTRVILIEQLFDMIWLVADASNNEDQWQEIIYYIHHII